MLDITQSDEIRARFSTAMSEMYRQEVPLYSDLINLVQTVNNELIEANALLKEHLIATNELNRLDTERHGAIRLGTGQELNNIRRLFAIMGMQPVGYYDLSLAGLPVHSTAFRPINALSLAHSPFRIFTSLLRLELIEDRALACEAEELLSKRQIITPRALELIALAEQKDSLEESEIEAFICEALETFRWHSQATVSIKTYERLKQAHSLIADVVSFKGPHINHLTPRTLDIDVAQERMNALGMIVKPTIEGPPKRKIPVLLRQTSFKALEENITFHDNITGIHTARFGEIEQRGVALTKKGRDLYDKILSGINDKTKNSNPTHYVKDLSNAFSLFPDSIQILHSEKLAFFTYQANKKAVEDKKEDRGEHSVEKLLSVGALMITPQVYEDFLPVSAAGIFQSNIQLNQQSNSLSKNNKNHQVENAQKSNQEVFEKHLGVNTIDEMKLYKEIEENSLKEALAVLSSK